MEITQEPTKYCLYARKSSEQDERQALSIESQIGEMQRIADEKGIKITGIRRESHSAKNSGERPEFSALIKEIEEGIYNGIITWAPDRLSRNAGDLGAMVDLMDRGKLLGIHTNGQFFQNDPNSKFLLMILCSQAKLENDNRGKTIVRGMRSKCEKGWRPCMSPLGYLNERHYERGKSRVFVDPIRGPMVIKIFEKVAYENVTGNELVKWVRYGLNMRSRNDKMLSRSMVYKILDNPFYYGEFEYPVGSGNFYQGKHKPLITKDLFERARVVLARKHPTDPYRSHDSAFGGFFICDGCGRPMIAEDRYKQLKNGRVSRYTYYHCSRSVFQPCKEKYLREDRLIAQLLKLMPKLELDIPKLDHLFSDDIERFKVFSQGVMGKKSELGSGDKDYRKYLKFVLEYGGLEERKRAISGIRSVIRVKNQVVKIEAK